RARGVSARDVSGANPSREHRVPAPERLLPEGARPSELAALDHILIAAPSVVDEYVQTPLLVRDTPKRRPHLFVVAVVAFDGGALARKVSHLFDGAARDVEGRARFDEFERDSFPDPATRPRDERDLFF